MRSQEAVRAHTQATRLERLLRERIRREGPLSFRDVMQAALYDPRFGYYTNLSRFEDFLTSPEVHPAFGWLVGRQVLDVWHALGEPRPFRVLEVGAGSGALAESLLAYVQRRVPSLEYDIDEPSPALRAAQQQRLGHEVVNWNPNAPAHVVVANEVADALPVHRVIVRDGRLRELRVGLDAAERLTWLEADDAPGEVEAYFASLGVRPPDGGIAEVSTGLRTWTEELVAHLDRGLALVLDYGYPAEQLFSRPRGTLLTYYRHTLGSEPLVRLGAQDISAHVDFSTLALAARAAGVRVAGVTSQATFLRNLGIGGLIEAARTPLDRGRLTGLVEPTGLGRIGALFLTRGLPEYTPVGLSGGVTWPTDDGAPALEADDDDFAAQWREAFFDAPETQEAQHAH